MIHTDDFMFCSLQSIFSIYISVRKLSSFKRLAELLSFPKFDEEEIESQSVVVLMSNSLFFGKPGLFS